MKKWVLLSLFLPLINLTSWAQIGGDYDPTNPSDPGEPILKYTLTLNAIPSDGGSFNTTSTKVSVGQRYNLRAYPNSDFAFVAWLCEGDTLSKSASYDYTMPAHDVDITGVFTYQPSSPSDPQEQALKYQLSLVAEPINSGSFNISNERLAVGSKNSLRAYSNTDFVFKNWSIGDSILSTTPNLEFIMPSHNVEIVGHFEYNPASPPNPNKNYWNKLLGEVIVDDFTPGSLSSAISAVIGGSSRNDVYMITVAGVINSNDFGIANNYPNCTLLDLSRVTGVSEVPSYAFDYSNLESVYLPATIEKIGYRAFYECKQLSSLTIYAMTPPTLESNVFKNVPEGLVIYVPAAAIAQYQDAEGWKDFTLLPIQEDIRNITVSLPEGAKPADFAQMWLELTNTKNGQRIHYVMTDRTTYTFMNIIRNTSWNVTLRNERGDVFGQIENVEVKDEDVSVVFSKLSKPQNVALTVQTPNGQDVTDQTQITWTDTEGNYVAQGTSLTGLPIGYQANYRVALSQELAMQYDTPQPAEYVLKDGRNNIVCQLEAIKQIKISGKVREAETNLPLSGAIISASQTFAGKYSKTLNAKADNKGEFVLDVANVPTSVAFSATDYVSQTMVCDSLLNDEAMVVLPDIALKPISGAVISLDLTYTACVADGEEAETQNWYSDYQNVSYSIFNETKGHAITQFVEQYPQIVLLEDVEDGDELRLTASSRTNSFMPLETTATIVEQKATASFDIKELGKIQSSYVKSDNASVVGSLYDASGKLIRTYDYSDASLTINNLTDGRYTLVSMGSSPLFNTIYDLSQLPQTGLIRGSDYVQNQVDVKSGIISSIAIAEVPKLDESKLYYTGGNTLFTVNKPSIVVGNYLTLTGHIDFKSAYASEVSNVQMIVDLPESCEFVENSVMVGNSTSSYILNGHQITIPMARYTDRVRFCVIPTLGGEYAPSAFVQFDLNGETMTQPIGSAYYTANDLLIIVPNKTFSTIIPISGTAIGVSSIEIYDDNILIGQTTSLANGTWSTSCELYKPYNLSTHRISAKVQTKAGLSLFSEEKLCKIDIDHNYVKTIKMSHYNEWKKASESLVIDVVNGTSNRNYYDFYHEATFTFEIDFANNDSTKLADVVVIVWNSSGEKTKLPAFYDEEVDKWIAYGVFNATNLPTNIDVDFEEVNPTKREDIDQIIDDYDNLFVTGNNTKKEIEKISSLLYDNTEDPYVESCNVRFDNLFETDSLNVDSIQYYLGEIVDTTYYNAYDNDLLDMNIKSFLENEDYFNEYHNNCLDSILNSYYLCKDYLKIDELFNSEISHFDKSTEYAGISYDISAIESNDVASLIEEGFIEIECTDLQKLFYRILDDKVVVIDSHKNIVISMTINYNGNSTAKTRMLRAENVPSLEFAECLDGIRGSINNLRNINEDTKTRLQKTLSVINDLANSLQCFYLTARGKLELDAKRQYDDNVKKIEDKIKTNSKDEKDVLSRINTNNKKINSLRSKNVNIQSDIDALNSLLDNNNLSVSERQFYTEQLENCNKAIKDNNKQVDELLRSIKKDKDVLRKITKALKKLSKQKLGQKEAYENALRHIGKLPKNLVKGVRLGKFVKTAGKLAGPLGVFIEAWSLWDDIQDVQDETQEWLDLVQAIESKLPCEKDKANAVKLYNDILRGAEGFDRWAISVIIAEGSALIADIATMTTPNIYEWIISGYLNAYGENIKTFIMYDRYVEERGNLWYRYGKLKCICSCDVNGNGCTCPVGTCKCIRCKKCNCKKGSKCTCKGKCKCQPPKPDIRGNIDPSGYVYESVASNRVEGVTATIFYKEMVEDMYGDLHENIVKWDAEAYAQKNPLFTDEYGMYRWDVPQGLWQVKFEKEGYETTYSEWLPVPPPQLEVNIAMQQNRQPEVKTARAYEDAVEVEFDKYMMPEFLTTENISVMQAGKSVDGSIVLLNEEARYEGETETFASKVRFNAAQPFTEQEITLLVNNRVKSYAGIRMQDNYQQEFTVEKEIKQILSDSLMVVEYGDIQSFIVSVLPASASAGKTLTVNSSSPLILEVETKEVTIDNTGKAEIIVSGELPGTAALTFSIEGTDKNAVTIVNVVQNAIKTVALPIASIASGSVVEKGTEISLSCSTKGSTIYYTLDGSCPCDDTPARKVYDGSPIIITQSVTIKAMATAPDMYDSEIAEFTYIVKDGEDIEELYLDPKVQIYPLPIKDVLNVKAGGNTIKYVSLTAINGVISIMEKCDAQQAVLDVSSLPSGVYIINVATDDNVYSSIVVK